MRMSDSIAEHKFCDLTANWVTNKSTNLGRTIQRDSSKKFVAHVFELDAKDEEYLECIKPFERYGSRLRAVRVERVQNYRLAKRYAAAFAEMHENRQDEMDMASLEETLQFHCSSSADVDLLCLEGTPQHGHLFAH